MKTPSTNLFLLIKSLSPSEKRYFSIFSGGETNYFKLFNAINQFDAVDEKNFSSKLSELGFKHNLKKTKQDLSEALEKCLVLYWNSNNPRIAVRELLSFAEILQSKELFPLSNEAIERGIAIAERFELLNEWRSFLQLKLYSMEAIAFKGFSIRDLEQVHIQLRTIQGKNEEINQFAELATGFHFRTFKDGHGKKQHGPIKDLPDRYEFKSYTGQLQYYNYKYAHFRLIRDFKNALKISTSALKLIESRPAMISFNPRSYIIALAKICHILLANKQPSRLFPYLKKLKELKTNTEFANNLRFYYYHSCQLTALSGTGNFAAGILLFEKETVPFLKAYNKKPQQKQMIYFLAAQLYFGAENYSKAQSCLNIILNERLEVRSDIVYYSKFLQLLIIHEGNNFRLLESAMKSAYYLLKKKNPLPKQMHCS